MPEIRLLPPSLAEKIAAGEVIERPASVVKELVENSLDAGAKSIRVEVDKIPIRSIQIIDDGCGMNLEEAKLAILRHATSKIKNEADLFCIQTLGFRGEALPSIAAVSHLTLQTKPNSKEILEGGFVKVVGSDLQEVRVCASPGGTKVMVEDLFFNTPARRKFLKSDAVELAQMENVVLSLALSRFDVAFQMIVDGKEKLSAPVSKDPRQRLMDCLGKNFVADCLEVFEENPQIQLRGFLVHPRQSAGNPYSVYTYLNGRLIRDRVVQHAMIQGYGDFLMRGRYPKAVLFIQMNPQDVDVNVHPSKREIRFQQPQAVHQFIERSIKKTLQKKIAGVDLPVPQESGDIGEIQFGGSCRGVSPHRAPPPGVDPPDSGPTPRHPPNCISPISFNALRVVGVFADSYILCESQEKLVVIDQHAAHERIGYEKLKKNYADRKESQRLLVPLTWEAHPTQTAHVSLHLEILKNAGLELEFFGGNTFVVKSIPSFIHEKNIAELLENLAQELETLERGPALQTVIDQVFKTMACHAQVRAHDKLSAPEVEHLLKEMEEYKAYFCPHGRPTAVEFSFDEIGHWFKRT